MKAAAPAGWGQDGLWWRTIRVGVTIGWEWAPLAVSYPVRLGISHIPLLPGDHSADRRVERSTRAYGDRPHRLKIVMDDPATVAPTNSVPALSDRLKTP
jgi:hypothetical protein